MPQRNATFLIGAGAYPVVHYAIDEYFNPLPVANVNFQPRKNIFRMNGKQLLAQSEGEDIIDVRYNGHMVDSFSMRAVQTPD